jgi:hypothetical protein
LQLRVQVITVGILESKYVEGEENIIWIDINDKK